MASFRGFIVPGFFSTSIEPHLQDESFSISSCVVPNSVEYTLRDLLASGQHLALTDTAILHDDTAIHSVIANSDSSIVDPSNVEPSNV